MDLEPPAYFPEVRPGSAALAGVVVDENHNIEFEKIPDPAPVGDECLMYFARNVMLTAKTIPNEGYAQIFEGRARGESQLFKWDYALLLRNSSDHYDLSITEENLGIFEENTRKLKIENFKQMEIRFELFDVDADDNTSLTLIHEEPSLGVPLLNGTWRRNGGTTIRELRALHFREICPAQRVQKALEQMGPRKCFLMRIYVKILNGDLDKHHGIQKSFQPDKAIADLRWRMEELLVTAGNADVTLVSTDKKRFKAHRAILAANSDMYKHKFASGLKDSNEAEISFDYSGKVLEAILKFIYTRNRKDLESCPLLTYDVWSAANFLQIKLLEKVCEECLLAMEKEKFTLKSALLIFIQASFIGNLALQSKAVQVIIRVDEDFAACQVYTDMLKNQPDVATELTKMIVKYKAA